MRQFYQDIMNVWVIATAYNTKNAPIYSISAEIIRCWNSHVWIQLGHLLTQLTVHLYIGLV